MRIAGDCCSLFLELTTMGVQDAETSRRGVRESLLLDTHELDEAKGSAGGDTTDNDHADGTPEVAAVTASRAREVGLGSSEEEEDNAGDDDGPDETGLGVVSEHVGDEGDETTEEVGETDGEGRNPETRDGNLLHALAKLEEEGGQTDVGVLGLGAVGLGRLDSETRVVLDLTEVLGDKTRKGLLDTERAKDGVNLTLHLAVTRTENTGVSLLAEVVEVVELGLRGEESSETHGDGAGAKLGEATSDDERRVSERRQTSRQSEGNGETVGQTDNTVLVSSNCHKRQLYSHVTNDLGRDKVTLILALEVLA